MRAVGAAAGRSVLPAAPDLTGSGDDNSHHVGDRFYGAQPLLRPVEPLSGTAGGQGGSAAGNDAAAEELLPEA